MKVCHFCGIGLTEDEVVASGPTTDYPPCCITCFEKHVIDHMNPKRDVLKEAEDKRLALIDRATNSPAPGDRFVLTGSECIVGCVRVHSGDVEARFDVNGSKSEHLIKKDEWSRLARRTLELGASFYPSNPDLDGNQ